MEWSFTIKVIHMNTALYLNAPSFFLAMWNSFFEMGLSVPWCQLHVKLFSRLNLSLCFHSPFLSLFSHDIIYHLRSKNSTQHFTCHSLDWYVLKNNRHLTLSPTNEWTTHTAQSALRKEDIENIENMPRALSKGIDWIQYRLDFRHWKHNSQFSSDKVCLPNTSHFHFHFVDIV